MPYIGWLDQEIRWHLPVHQPVEAADFDPDDWSGVQRDILLRPHPSICGVCSYDPRSGLPKAPVPYPCMAVRVCQGEAVPSPRTPVEDDGNYRPRPRRSGTPSNEALERTKGRKF